MLKGFKEFMLRGNVVDLAVAVVIGGAFGAVVTALVKDLIDSEDKRSPLSDVDLIARLKEKGVEVARRTITKYRQLMNIPPSRQRMQY